MTALAVVALSMPILAASTRIDLLVDEPSVGRSMAWPITTGVPFPRGELKDALHCRLVDDTGAEQPLQARVAATWDAKAASIRWLTIDFLARTGRKYALEFGDDVRRAAAVTTLAVTKGANIRVSTGPLAVGFHAHGASVLGPIGLDVNKDQRIAADEVVASGSAQGDHYYLDQNGRRYSSAADGDQRRISVEAAGPVRACIRVDGFYTGPGGERIARYRTRYHFFAGLPVIKVVDELKFFGSTKQTRFQDIGFAIDLPLATTGRTVLAEAADSHQRPPQTVQWRTDTQSVSAYQTTFRHYGNPECSGAMVRKSANGEQVQLETEKMGAWLQVAGPRVAVTGSLRWFWQQFPKEWEVGQDQLVLHLWSPRGGELDFGAGGIERFFGGGGEKYLRSGEEGHNRNPLTRFFYHADLDAIRRGAADGLGINKHHESYLHFAPASRAGEGIEYGRLAAEPPLALATGKWNCSTDVFGPLAARPNGAESEKVVDHLFHLSRRMQDEFGDYGWWLFGAGPHYSYNWDAQTQRFYADSRRFEYHTYGKETQLWWNYMRSGERKFYDWCLPAENHWVDIAVCHVPTSIECAWRGGQRDPRTLHWRPGEWSIDSPTHYVRHHDRAEAWLRGGAQFWASYHRTLETTTLAYYLTGDERFNDVVNFWRDYWADLAGKTSRSPDLQPWHRQQAWYKPTAAGEPAQTWAEMIRDYAPFHSGTRHNLTLFFNLATLYEHTWDPRIGQALREYADAFLDPAHASGAWRPQDSSLPAHAEAPSMAHFWVPALWKYTRVTGDPRMQDILTRYFDTAYAADPFREHEHVGVYSNSYPGYAYYYTRDPRHLTLASMELERLLPFGEPLARPQDINARLYNPYAPIRSFAGIPRLLWALQEARRTHTLVPPRPHRPQRTAIALRKPVGQELRATLWGYEPRLRLIGPDGKLPSRVVWKSQKYASEIQPFDRITPDYEVYLHELTLPADAADGFYLLAPDLELAVLAITPDQTLLWNAARPIAVTPGDQVSLAVKGHRPALILESAAAASLRVWDEQGNLLASKATGGRLEVGLSDPSLREVRIGAESKPAWFRIAELPEDECWVVPGAKAASHALPGRSETLAALRPVPMVEAESTFLAGRFGRAVQVVPGRPLHIPDHILIDGAVQKLFDEKQGTLEFWVRKQWDERLIATRQANLLSNGMLTAPNRPTLPLDDWAHVAIVWLPYGSEPQQTITYVYVNGRDTANYRSLNWEGYSSVRPSSGPPATAWRKELLGQALPGAAYAIDELRVSATPRYADPNVNFGPQQTFNPFRFRPSDAPFVPDEATLLLMHFDGELNALVPVGGVGARLGK